MNVRISLLIIGLFVGIALQAGPAFDKAIKKELTESESHYIGRLEMLALWIAQKLIEYRSDYMDPKIGRLPNSSLLAIPPKLTIEIIDLHKYSYANDAIYEILGEINKKNISQEKVSVLNGYWQKVLDQLLKFGGKTESFVDYAKILNS